MAKKKLQKENEEIEEIETAEENEEIETDDEGEEKPPKKVLKKKDPVFPIELPPSEPPPEPKPKKDDDVVFKALNELNDKLEKVLTPKEPTKEKREYRLFDEFDPTLESEV